MSGVLLAMLLSSLDQTIVSTAMPQIVREFNSLSHLSWVFTAYMLASTVTVPIYGKLSDIFGRRNLYLIGIIIFLLGSVFSGMSQSMLQLILFRGLQGIGGGAMMVNSFAIIGDIFPPAERGKWQGVIGGVFGLSSIAGPLLGGFITDNLSWRWVFYVNIPLGLIAIGVLAAAMPKIKHTERKKPIDYLGSVLLTTALVPLLLALVWGGSLYSWNSWQIVSMIVVFLLSAIAFIRTESKVADPVVSLDLFKSRVFVVSVISLFLTAMAMFGAILYIPVFAQGIIGVSATNAGLILTPMMLSLVIASAVSGQIISRTGKYKILLVSGTALTVVAMFLFSKLGLKTNNLTLMLRMILLGAGLGSTMPIFTIAVQSAFPKARLGEVTAGTQLFRSIGGSVGTAVLGGLMNASLTGKLTGINALPFAKHLKAISPEMQRVNTDNLQQFLNPEMQHHLNTMFSGNPQMLHYLAGFMTSIKTAFSYAIDNVFIATTLLMILCLISNFFMPEIPLRRKEKPSLKEVGLDLESEFGNTDRHRPPQFGTD